MSVDDPTFVAWEEHIVCNERGNRVVHYYLKEADGNSVLAVLGTERSIRHMIYVIAEEFVKEYESKNFINPSTKWRARREVVEWLTSMTSKNHSDSQMDSLTQSLGSLEVSEPMIERKFKARNSDIAWSGVPWVHSFVFIMDVGQSNYLGYLEDMYEDKKGLKKVKVRWFHRDQEVKHVMSQLNPHPREVFMTTHVQVISAESVDGLATVLTPKHFEKFVNAVPDSSRFMCSRQLKNNRIKPFTITKLKGYHSQAIFSASDGLLESEKYGKSQEEGEELTLNGPASFLGTKRKRSSKGVESSIGKIGTPPCNQRATRFPKVKFRFSKKPLGIKSEEPRAQNTVSSKVGEKVEFLSQDSGINGCWFRCKVLQANQKRVKVQYDDLLDADDSGKLEEWIPACRVVAPDKLGMRCTGRLTIRPRPEDLANPMFEVGAAVDAWWCDGWWEGVVTKVDGPGNCIQVYLPGESKFLNVDKKTLRTSRDWLGDEWVEIKAMPDILGYISANATPRTKPPPYPVATIEVSGGGSLNTIPELVAVKELPQANAKTEIKNGNGDEIEAGVSGKEGMAMEEDVESANPKCEVAEVPKVLSSVV
ncbi:uncharacterized protein [Rutidosis leptorrhynchoides]|uniref:uncharacterized protein n=1 Tax=Rutidosis leptorrhynchoides TaxID=125765 RepID=UPI003A99B893